MPHRTSDRTPADSQTRAPSPATTRRSDPASALQVFDTPEDMAAYTRAARARLDARFRALGLPPLFGQHPRSTHPCGEDGTHDRHQD